MTQTKLSVLLIEDNLALARQICRFLEGLGWLVDYADTGRQGIALAQTAYFDVIILDLNLPDCDGLTVCERIKQEQQRVVPILMLTARDAFEDKARGFARGTDDYLTKPCDLRELAMRCKALARRPALHSDARLVRGAMALDARSLSVTWAEQPVKLTKTAATLLKQLIEAYPHPVARSDLIDAVWGAEPPESNALKSHLYGLRKALEKIPDGPRLQTISNIGYQLVGLDDV